MRFYYYAQTTTGNTWNHRVQVRVYANNDAYVNSDWTIFNDEAPNYVMDGVLLANDPSYSSNGSTAA